MLFWKAKQHRFLSPLDCSSDGGREGDYPCGNRLYLSPTCLIFLLSSTIWDLSGWCRLGPDLGRRLLWGSLRGHLHQWGEPEVTRLLFVCFRSIYLVFLSLQRHTGQRMSVYITSKHFPNCRKCNRHKHWDSKIIISHNKNHSFQTSISAIKCFWCVKAFFSTLPSESQQQWSQLSFVPESLPICKHSVLVPEWWADPCGCEDMQEGLHCWEQGEVHERSEYVDDLLYEYMQCDKQPVTQVTPC